MDDNQDSTIGEIMDSAAEIGKRGVRTVQAGMGAVTKAAGKIPRVVRRVAGKDETGTETPPEEIIVEGLRDDLVKCYLSVLVWLVHTDDSQIDEREMCEIQLLMTQRRCNADVRKAVREHLENPRSLDALKQIDHMLKHGPAAGTDTQLALKCALMKDAIRVRRATSDGLVREWPEIGRLAEMLELGDKKLRFIEDACLEDEKILAGEVPDSQIAATAKDLAARATSVGVPVVAVYLSGSVTGLSAAGIASGLAALGLGGVLGLSAMVSGIGVAIIVGGTAYKGVRVPIGRRAHQARRASKPLRARPAGRSGGPRGAMNESTRKQAERAALVQRFQLDALHRALQSLEGHLAALESESAWQSDQLSRLAEQIARLRAEADLTRASSLPRPDIQERPGTLPRPGTQPRPGHNAPEHLPPSPPGTSAVHERSPNPPAILPPPDLGENWEAYTRNVERYIADHAIQVTPDPLAQLLPPHRAAEIRRQFDTDFGPAPWDPWDYGVVALAVIVGALTDYLLVATPGGSFKGKPPCIPGDPRMPAP